MALRAKAPGADQRQEIDHIDDSVVVKILVTVLARTPGADKGEQIDDIDDIVTINVAWAVGLDVAASSDREGFHAMALAWPG